MLIEGWARLYEEETEEKGGLYSFTHTVFIYATRGEAEDREKDTHAKFLGVFPVKWELEGGRVTFFPTIGPTEPLREAGEREEKLLEMYPTNEDGENSSHSLEKPEPAIMTSNLVI